MYEYFPKVTNSSKNQQKNIKVKLVPNYQSYFNIENEFLKLKISLVKSLHLEKLVHEDLDAIRIKAHLFLIL